MSGLSWLGVLMIESFWPSCTSQAQPDPKRPIAAAWNNSLNLSNDPNEASMDFATAPLGAPPLPLPISRQKALWFLHQQAPHSTAYNISLPVRVLSALDTAALRRALQRVIDRHAILRTTYDVVDGEPGQQVAGRADVAFDVHAVPGLCDADLQRVQLAGRAERLLRLEHAVAAASARVTDDARLVAAGVENELDEVFRAAIRHEADAA